MSTLTIRNLDEETKQALRLRAAMHGVSMEKEVRTILKMAVLPHRKTDPGEVLPGKNFYESVRELVEPHGGFEMEIPARSRDLRDPPSFE